MRAALAAFFVCLAGHASAGAICAPRAIAAAERPDLAGLAEAIPANGAQFWFLAGLYFASPDTPPGLPLGDCAVQIVKEDETIAVFLDGDLVCSSVHLHGASLQAFKDAGDGVLHHSGEGL